MPLDDDDRQRIADYRAKLVRLGPQGRRDFVDAARRNEDWPPPQQAYLITHAGKWGRGRKARDYADWAYTIKNRAGVIVLAYIHPVHQNRGLAFIDVEEDVVVQFDCDQNLNFDCMTPSKGTRRWMVDQEATGTHWRLRDTER